MSSSLGPVAAWAEGLAALVLYPGVESLCYAVGDHEIVVQDLVKVKNWDILSSDNLSSLRMHRNADIGP